MKYLYAILILLTSTLAHATTYYLDCQVSSSGNGLAWSTAWKALSNITGLAAGDILYISGSSTCASYSTTQWVIAGGTSSSPITYSVGQDAGHTSPVTITLSGAPGITGTTGTLGWSTITGNFGGTQNMTISGSIGASGSTPWNGLRLSYLNLTGPVECTTCQNYQIDHNVVTVPNGADHFFTSGASAGVIGYTQNSIHDNILNLQAVNDSSGHGSDGFQWIENVTFYNNTTYWTFNASANTQHADGIQTSGSYVDIHDNYCENAGNYCVYGDLFGSILHWRAYNNVFAEFSGHGTGISAQQIGIGFECSSCGTITDMVISNNTFYRQDSGQSCVTINPGNTGNSGVYTIVNNTCYNTSINSVPGTGGSATLSNNFSGTTGATFVNIAPYPTGNWQETSGSTSTIGQGINPAPSYLTSVYTTDKNGAARANPWDTGAYQFSANTTWFIRKDGGTATQCTGKTNAAYPGAGSAQNCALNHPYWMINTAGTGWAHMVAGDTVQFVDTGTSKTYLMGEQNAGIGTDWNANGLSSICPTPNPGQANGASCIMPAPPNNTTWLGQNAGSCHDSGHSHLVNPTILSGIAGAFAVLDTRSTSGVTYSCIEVTQPDTCTTVGNGTGMCGNLANFVHFGGLVMNYLTGPGPTSLTLTDFAAVGIGSQGILGSNLRGTTTLTDVYVIGNGGEGWNADGGGCGTSCEDTGTINEHYNIYAWNGCMAVNYDMTKTFQLNSYNYCMAQTTGAFASGDGQVMIAAGNVTLNVDHSQFQNNVQDGFDALHLNDDPSTTPSININTSIAAHNLGQTFKLGAGSNSTAINNVSIQDCRAMTVDANYPLNPSGWSNGNTNVADQCRAQGEAWVFAVKAGATVTAQNNTTIGYGTTTYTVGCAVGVTTCITGGAIMAFQNNTTYGLPDPGNSGQFASGFFFGNGDIFANAGSVMNFNNWYQMRTGCPNSTTPEETNQVCGNPSFQNVTVSTDGTLITFNGNITSGSLLAAAGTHIAGITTDFNGNAVTNPPAIGAFTPTGSGPTVVSIAIAPTSVTINVGGTTALTCTATYSDSSTAPCTSPVWSSGTPSHATVNSSTGVVTGVANGTSLVSAVASGFTSNNSTITVTTPLHSVTSFGAAVIFGPQTTNH